MTGESIMSDPFGLDQIGPLVDRIRSYIAESTARIADLRGRVGAARDALVARLGDASRVQAAQLVEMYQDAFNSHLATEQLMAKLDDELTELSTVVTDVTTNAGTLMTDVVSLIDAVKAGGGISEAQIAQLDAAQQALSTAATSMADLDAQVKAVLNPPPPPPTP